ncbi:MAG: flagellar biosynthetic protein FliR [Pseudohongiellaceae bacterium]|nr:flagellar biosynthetic protein FliR [Pseudohongiellaceae bacterium]
MGALGFTAEAIGGMLGTYLWPLFRVMGFFMAAPLIGTQLVPVRIRVVLAVAVTLAVAPLLPPVPAIDGISFGAGLLVAQQLLIGAALGFFMQLLFQVFVLAGQIIAMQMGLGFASMVDPSNGVNVAILSTVYLMLVMLLFVTFDGHLAMIEVLAESFIVIPIGDFGRGSEMFFDVAATLSWVFSSALVLALPALTALLISNFAFGIMTRAAPQLNIFALGFPVALMFGLFIIWITFGNFLVKAENIFSDFFAMTRAIM